jgi:hypothetical protein
MFGWDAVRRCCKGGARAALCAILAAALVAVTTTQVSLSGIPTGSNCRIQGTVLANFLPVWQERMGGVPVDYE